MKIKQKLPFHKLKNLLYIFQQEEYEIPAFWRWVRRVKKYDNLEQKQTLVWTQKAKLLFVLVILFWLFLMALLCSYCVFIYALQGAHGFAFFQGIIGAILLLLSFYLFPHFYLIMVFLLLKPLDFYLKKRILMAARKKLQTARHLKIVGITGSYGKTTVKEFLSTLLSCKYRVLKTPQNINTPLGIAALIKKENLQHYDIFLVEMGAYRPGDIKQICDLVKPEKAILTGITQSHLERFGSLAKIIQTKFELIESLPADGRVFLNGDDVNVGQNYQKFGQVEKRLYSYKLAQEIEIKPDGLSFRVRLQDQTLECKARVLGKHNITNLMGAILLALDLGVSPQEIEKGVAQIKSIKHRLEPIFNPNGVLVIDDSYNGNPAGVKAALDVLSQFKDKRKILITPGLVELGESQAKIHVELGRLFTSVCDLLILMQNSNLPYFLKGLREGGWDVEQNNYSKEPRLLVFPNSQAAHAVLPQILKKGDVILFQNDWTDNYI